MKVGDLVTLSTYGNRVKRTGWVNKGDLGLVKSVDNNGGWITYGVHWMKSDYRTARRTGVYGRSLRGCSWDWENWFGRKDLKFAKKKKG